MSLPPDQMKTAIADVFDRVSGTYDNVGVEYFSAFGRRLVELAAVAPGDRVLDVGCGRGAVTFAAVDAVGQEGEVVGIDLAPGMVRHAAEIAAERGATTVSFRVGDAEAPDVEGPFDVVLAGLVIFFLPDPMAGLRAYRGLLRDGGRLGMTTFPPPPDGAWGRVGKVIQRYRPGQGAVSRPGEGPLASPEALEEALRSVGFREVDARTEAFDTGFRDRDHWWQWAWSHVHRAALERIPADELDAVRDECYGILASETRPDGSVALRQLITYTVATA